MNAMPLIRLAEPKLLFGHNQAVEDPRDGLSLFGPLDKAKTYGIRPAVIGTRAGLDRFWRWVDSIQRPLNENKASRPPFPGFEARFGVPFGGRGVFERVVDEESLITRAISWMSITGYTASSVCILTRSGTPSMKMSELMSGSLSFRTWSTNAADQNRSCPRVCRSSCPRASARGW